MIPADKNDNGPPAGATSLRPHPCCKRQGNANLFLLPGSESGAMPGQSSKTLMDTLGRAGRTATFPGNVLSLKARSVRSFTL